jgi:hypothetical protein
MPEQIQIKKTIYSADSINNIINTNFTQLARTVKDIPSPPDMSINDFFQKYDELFYEIPLSGSDQSHLGLVTRSSEYLGLSLDDLQNEIDFLREENIDLKNQIYTSSQITTGSLEI